MLNEQRRWSSDGSWARSEGVDVVGQLPAGAGLAAVLGHSVGREDANVPVLRDALFKSNPAVSEARQHRLGPVVDIQLAQDRGDVVLHRLGRNV